MTDIKRPITQSSLFLNRTLLNEEDILSGNYWAELRVFLAVAKAKSFNRAGEMLGVSSMTVSRQVRRLQDLLKTELFVTGAQGVQLTPAGMDLAVTLARLDIMLNSITRALGNEPDDPAGEVRVSITEGLAVSFVAASISDLTELHPRISIALLQPRNLNDLRQNNADIALGFHQFDDPDFVCNRLGTLHFVPVASTLYLDRFGEPTLDTLEDHLFLQSPYYAAANDFWKPWTNAVARGRTVHSSENSLTYGLMAKAGLGVALLANYATIEPRVEFVDLDIHIRVPIYAIADAKNLNQPAVRVTFDWLCSIFSGENPWLQDRLTFGHAPSHFDRGFRLLFNLA